LALGDGTAGPSTQTLTFNNAGGSDMTYNLTHVAGVVTGPSATPSAVDPAGEYAPSLFVASATAAFSATTITVPAGGSASVSVTITQPTAANFFIYGGYIVATPSVGGMPLRVPYMGVTGDYSAYSLFQGSPLLSRTRTNPVALTDGAVFTMADANHVPYVIFHLRHSSTVITTEVFSAPATPGGAPGKAWHVAA